MSYLERVRALQTWEPSAYRPFTADGRRVGLIHRDFIPQLADFGAVLQMSDAEVALAPELGDAASRSAAMAEVLAELRSRDLIPGWRNEPYAVCEDWGTMPLFQMERAAVPLFGTLGYGVHLNGFVRDGDRLKMWVGKRSMTKPTGPGKLDQLVAGGLPAGIGVMDNLIKECVEEAGIPEGIARPSPSGPCPTARSGPRACAATYCSTTIWSFRPTSSRATRTARSRNSTCGPWTRSWTLCARAKISNSTAGSSSSTF